MKKKPIILSLLILGVLALVLTVGIVMAKYQSTVDGSDIDININEHDKYTYAVLIENEETGEKTLSIRNRKAVVVYDENNNPIELIDKDGTYALGDSGVVYALPYQQGQYDNVLSTDRIAAGNVPEGAIETGWSTIHNDDSGNIEQTAIYVAFDDVVYLQGKLDQLFQKWPNVTNIDLTNADFTNVTSVRKMFDTCGNLTSITFADEVNTAKVTSMKNMFYDLAALTSLNVGGFNTSNVTNMNGMFYKLPLVSALDVSGFDTSKVTDMSGMFWYCGTVTELNVSNFDTDNVTDMSSMFWWCNSLENLDVSNFNTSNVTSMHNMFGHCLALTELDVSNFDTANVTSMSGMFQQLSNLTSLDLTKFNTAKVTDMSNMFYASKKLTEIKWEFEENKFTTANVTNMSGMFNECYALTTLNVSGFDTSKVTNMGYMFRNCQKLTQLDVSSFVTGAVTDMQRMFFSCQKLTSLDLSSFNTNLVTNMTWMFGDCEKLVTIYVSDQFVTGQVTSDGNMFGNSGDFSSPKIKGGNGTSFSSSYTGKTYARVDGMNGEPGYFTAIVQPKMDEDADMTWSFNGTDNFNVGKESTLLLTSTSEDGTLPGYVYLISSVEGVDPVFAEVTNGVFTIPTDFMMEGSSFTIMPAELYTYTVLDETTNALSIRSRAAAIMSGSLIGKDEDTTYLVDSTGAYALGDSGVIYALPKSEGYGTTTSGQNVAKGDAPADAIENGWTTQSGTNYSLETTVTSVTFDDTVYLQGDIRMLFQNWTILESVDLTKADFSNVTVTSKLFDNCPLLKTISFADTVDMKSVTDMSYMFQLLPTLENLNLSGVKTSAVTNMTSMFYNCKVLTSLDLGNFNTANVTSLVNMFDECHSLTTINLSSFDTSNVTSMAAMFDNCKALTSLDLSNFNTSKVTDMSGMFCACGALQSINFGSSFNTSNVETMTQMFAGCSSLTSLDVSQFNTSSVTNMALMFRACNKLQTLDVSGFDTSSVSNMSGMFRGCSVLQILNLSNFNTASVTSMSDMFNSCKQLHSLNLSSFNTSEVTNMSNMFNACNALTVLDLSNFDTSKVTNMGSMFYQAGNLKTIYVSDDFVLQDGTDTSNMFNYCKALQGGNGTTYSAAGVTDGPYARIDGSNGLRGYFTAATGTTVNYAVLNVELSGFDADVTLPFIFLGEAATITLKPTDGSALPTDVTVTIGETEVDVTYTVEDGTATLTIPAESMAELNTNVTVTAASGDVEGSEGSDQDQEPSDEPVTNDPVNTDNTNEETQSPADEDNSDEETQPPVEEDVPDGSEQPSNPPVEVITEDAAPPKEPEEEETPTETPTEGDPPTEE